MTESVSASSAFAQPALTFSALPVGLEGKVLLAPDFAVDGDDSIAVGTWVSVLLKIMHVSVPLTLFPLEDSMRKRLENTK